MKKILSKIKAMFSIGGKGVVLDVKRADIREDKTYLYPADDDKKAYVIKSKSIEILFNDGFDIADDDFFVIDRKSATARRVIADDNAEPEISDESRNECATEASYTKEKQSNSSSKRLHLNRATQNDHNPYFQKRKFTVTLYGDELELMQEAVRKSGLKQADFIMACLQNSQKKSVYRSFAAECERVKRFRANHTQAVKEYYQSLANENSNVNASGPNSAPQS